MFLKLRYDGLLSNFAFNCNLRPDNEDDESRLHERARKKSLVGLAMVGRCRLIVSKPGLKAPTMVPALETIYDNLLLNPDRFYRVCPLAMTEGVG